MNIDTRARRAARGIHEAVEVRDMTMQTKEPRPVERFDDYRNRKEQNRKRGAILVAAAVVLATILAFRAIGTPEEGGPADGGGPVPGTAAGFPDGTWRTETITKQQVQVFLAHLRMSEAADAVISEQGYPTMFTWSIRDGRFATTDSDGRLIDKGSMKVEGARLIFSNDDVGGEVVYTWTLDGNTLHLTFVSDSAPFYQGYPDEVFNRPIYELSPLTLAP